MKLTLQERAHPLSVVLLVLASLSLDGCASQAPTSVGSGGATGAGGKGNGGATGGGGSPAQGGAGGTASVTGSGGQPQKPLVALVQSSRAEASDVTDSDVVALVSDAVTRAGGLDFIADGATVVLKPSLPTFYQDDGMTTASTTANGIATDWRVVKAVADLVRRRNPTGKVLVMEGSRLPTALVYSILGYSSDSFGAAVDELVALEGSSCTDTSTDALVERRARSGKSYWLNRRYAEADVVISIPTLKTDADAGIAGAVESLGVGATPAGQYGSGKSSIDCARGKIGEAGLEASDRFIRDYYGIRPADFVVVDGLQGIEHGPVPAWDDSGTYDYESSTKNMRLILAGRNAVAVDTVAALVMKCLPEAIPYLTGLRDDGFGPTDPARIAVVGKAIADVAQAFAAKRSAICPGR